MKRLDLKWFVVDFRLPSLSIRRRRKWKYHPGPHSNYFQSARFTFDTTSANFKK